MADLTFEQLPQAVYNLQQQLDEIEGLLRQLLKTSDPDPDQILTVQEAAAFLRLSVPTIYGLISRRELPVMKTSKRCYFSRLDLTEYLKAGRVKTVLEIKEEAGMYLRNKKGLKR